MPSDPAFPSALADLSALSGPGVGCRYRSGGGHGCDGPVPPRSGCVARGPGHRCLDRSRCEPTVADSTAALGRARDGGEGRIDLVQWHAPRREELGRRLPGNHRRHPPCHPTDTLGEGMGRGKKADGQNPGRAHGMEIGPESGKSSSLPEEVERRYEMAPRRRHRGQGSSGGCRLPACRGVGLLESAPIGASESKISLRRGLTRCPCGPPHRPPSPVPLPWRRCSCTIRTPEPFGRPCHPANPA